jgi:hypothetical protein
MELVALAVVEMLDQQELQTLAAVAVAGISQQ